MKVLYTIASCGQIYSFLRIPWVRINGDEALVWDIAASLFGVREELSTEDWGVLFVAGLFLLSFIISAGQSIKTLWTSPDGKSAYREANDIAILIAFGNLLFRAIVKGTAILFQASEIQSTPISIFQNLRAQDF